MSVDVREISLHDAVKFIVDNRGKTVPTADNGIPLIATNCIKNNGLFPVFEKIRFVSEETYKTWFRSHPEPGDIIFVNKGTPGRVCLVPNPVNFCIAQDMVALRVDESVIYPKYLFAALRSDYIQNVIENMHVGTLIPHFKKSDFERLMIPVPDEVTQKYIGNLYYDLSMAIELNNQINKTLEEMAQAIFKSWFVDFEPFRDGEFEESEIGPIPKGWRVVELGEITEEIRERVKDRKIPVFSAVKTGDLVLSEDYFTKQVFSRDISKYIVVKPFDFAYNPARINIGSIGINEFSYTGCVSPVYVVFRTDQKYKWFFKMLTRTERFKKEVNTRASGSVRQTLNFDEFSKIKVVYPYAEIVEEYNYIFEGLIMAKSKIEEEISILSEIRDTLLPKLMSGEIRVPVEEVI